jgi:hypothetical protein
MTEPIIIYPTGLIGLMNFAPFGVDVVKPLQAPNLLVRTPGVYDLNYIVPATQGTVEVSVEVGTAGANRLVAFLVDSWTSLTKYVGLGVDAQNQPVALLSVDGLGTVYGLSAPPVTPIPSGTRLSFRLAYDLRTPMYEDVTAVLQVHEEQGDWGVLPKVSVESFTPRFLVVGFAGIGLSEFNGSIRWVQACGDAEMIRNSLVVKERFWSTMVAGSTLSAGIIGKFAVEATLAGSSNMSSPEVVFDFSPATLAGDSGLTSDILGSFVLPSSLDGDSGVVSDLTGTFFLPAATLDGDSALASELSGGEFSLPAISFDGDSDLASYLTRAYLLPATSLDGDSGLTSDILGSFVLQSSLDGDSGVASDLTGMFLLPVATLDGESDLTSDILGSFALQSGLDGESDQASDLTGTFFLAATSLGGSSDLTSALILPDISGIAPAFGSTLGGAVVTLTGTNLSSVTGVTIGGEPCTVVTVDTDSSVRCVSPALALGAHDVQVTTFEGAVATLAGGYTVDANLITDPNLFESAFWDKTYNLDVAGTTGNAIMEDTTIHVHHLDQHMAGFIGGQASVMSLKISGGTGAKRNLYILRDTNAKFYVDRDTGVTSGLVGCTVTTLVDGSDVYVTAYVPTTLSQGLKIYLVTSDYSIGYLGTNSTVNVYDMAVAQ